MHLSEMAAKMRHIEFAGSGDPAISGVTADSREVRPGFLFAAVAGTKTDGTKFVKDAIDKGAAALLLADLIHPKPALPILMCEDIRRSLGEAADAFYDRPSASLNLIGITGTNGKTTTAFLLRHLYNAAARKAGMLGTIEYDLGDRAEAAPLTTPDAVNFTRCLAEMRDFGCKAAVVEVSSHALAQDRTWPHRFSAAVFTNLTRDHLDYHGDMKAYLEAKRKLFTSLDKDAVAVVNFRDAAAPRIMEGCKAKVFSYFLAGDGDEPADAPAGLIRAEITKSDLSGQTFRIHGEGMDEEYRTPLVGRHNVENCLGCLLTGLKQGLRPSLVKDALARFPGVPGRLERIESAHGAKAFVDYSHTDDALRSVLSVLRPLVKGKLITVFGCGGDRDPGKRPMMARAAEELSDHVVVTSDNPRTEDPERIIDAVMPGFRDPSRVTREADRPKAVAIAVGMAGPDDAVLVAGKGHEDYQIVGTEKRHMDDRELVRNAFTALERNRR